MSVILLIASGARGGTSHVYNTSDSGSGSLRQAVTTTNGSPGANTVLWDESAGGTISLASDLPSINTDTTLDVSNSSNSVTISGSSWKVPLAGTVTFQNDNLDTTWTISSIVGGAGTLVKTGGGNLTLTGANTYTGGAWISGGTLVIGADSGLGDASGRLTFNGGALQITADISSSRPVTLAAGGGTVDTQSYDLALSGAIDGSGGLTKEGTGVLVLTGANTYSGGTTVSSGTLQLGADNALPSVGAVSVSGDAVLDAGGYTQTVSQFTNAGVLKLSLSRGATNLTVTGTASLSGTLEVGFAPQLVSNGQTFTPITAGSLSGTFAGIDSPAAVSFIPSYSGTGVLLTAALVPFANIASTPNQAAVGRVLEPLRQSATGDLATVIGNMNTLDTDELRSAFDQIGPGSLASTRELARIGSDMQSSIVNRRAAAVLGGDPERAPGFSMGFFLSPAGESMKTREQGVTVSTCDSRFNVAGVVGGMDFIFAGRLAAGVYGGYLGGSATVLRPSEGTVESQSGRVGGYLAATMGSLRLQAGGGIAADSYKTKREISFGEIARTATASPDGKEVNSFAEASYNLPVSGWGNVSPFISANDDVIRVNSFSESGADDLNLAVKAWQTESERSDAGARFSTEKDMGTYVIGTVFGAGWRHEFKDPSPIYSQLAGGGGEFSVVSGKYGKDGATAEVELSASWTGGISIRLGYSGDFRPKFNENIYSGGIHVKF
jgi:autotransporter-associated beta strand protein